MKKIIFLLLVFSSMHVISQQNVKGIITDKHGTPILIETNISIKGTDKKTLTDYKAEYSITANKSDVLVFAHPGYQSQEIKVGDKNVINVVLERETIQRNGPHKVVFIIVDGISTDMYYKANTPYLDAISKDGAFTEAYVGGKRGTYSETPTISAVGYNSLLTGTWVNKHNVYWNSILNPNYNYPTVFRLLKDSFPNKKTAIYSTWLDNRTKLVGEGLEATGNIKVDYHFDGLELNEELYPHDDQKKYLKRIDAEVARTAATHIYEEGPDLSWVYLEHTDDMGHLYGDSKQLYEAISYEDALIGLIWDATKLREEKTGENWLVIITTDHGRRPIDGKHHGYQSYRERSTWIALSKPIENTYFKNNKVSIVDIFPTITDYMGIPIPQHVAYELDGVSLTNTVDAFNLEATCYNGKYLNAKWLTESKNNEQAKIFISYSNNKKEGGIDNYKQIGEIDVQKRAFNAQINPPKKCKYAKLVLETKNHTINTWIKIKP
ncbi:alkaline phosphatase family protein [Flavivirga abyssicola]|uniref:alkaline phosphatase family protein n=1 Tax=Flavivirga abyssicola TaxID=3063533 RepID=UPI0026E0E602|nr:alkaline phosphatase family protein [Flavivirga sp. MEBiC07777]WVK14390.1 alkaline phosphatase family protein [Flavivirga sp. MEBiC07777]